MNCVVRLHLLYLVVSIGAKRSMAGSVDCERDNSIIFRNLCMMVLSWCFTMLLTDFDMLPLNTLVTILFSVLG